MNKQLKLTVIALVALTLPMLSASAGEKPFPKIIPALDDSIPEGFAIGKGSTAYNGSIDGSIYKMNLRTGEGEIFVLADDPFTGCTKLGMRVDRRSNNLIVAGCEVGNALVYDADTGEKLGSYQLDNSGLSAINDLAITQDMLTGTRVGQITDPSLNGVASGAMHGDSLYVNNAHYDAFVEGGPYYSERLITKLNIYDVE